MQITSWDYLRIMIPGLRDPATEARREATLERAEALGPFTLERVQAGIPLPLKLRRRGAERP